MSKLERTWRYDLVFGALMLALVALAVRMGTLLVASRDEALRRADRQQQMRFIVPGRPGNIFARTRAGPLLLAGSRQVPFCYADPSQIPDEALAQTCLKLSQILGLEQMELRRLVESRRSSQFIVVKRYLTAAEAGEVRAAKLRGVCIDYAWQRAYPNGSMASTVLGFRRHDGVAGEGIELSYDEFLRASDGRRVVLADAARREISTVAEETFMPRDGKDVYMSMDAVIQGYLEEAVATTVEKHEAKWGVGVVVEPSTGRVLAMYSWPGYDVNFYNKAADEDRTNKALVNPYEPGSAFKPIMAAAAVDAGLVTWETMIDCEGGVWMAPRGGRISDHGSRYGPLTVQDVIGFSSNIGMGKIGLLMGNSMLHEALGRFGFGRPAGIDLPGDGSGIVRPLRLWDTYSTPRVPFGQEVSVTALQLTMAFGALANGGVMMKPQLVDCVSDQAGNVLMRNSPAPVGRAVSAQTAAGCVEAMAQVVQRGTGKACRMEQWTSFGKTGTAQIAGRGGYVSGAYTSTFVGGAPVSRPRLVCLISVYWPNKSKGYYGSTVAAPFVKQVLEQSLSYMQVPPEPPGQVADDGGARARD